jgi:hypothetical protein
MPGSPKAVVLLTAQRFPLDTFRDDTELAPELQTVCRVFKVSLAPEIRMAISSIAFQSFARMGIKKDAAAFAGNFPQSG